MGILKVILVLNSGRGFLQSLFHHGVELEIGTFFEALKSERRLNYVRHELLALIDLMKTRRQNHDPFAEIEELNGFDIHGGDGHYHKASTHDEKIGGKKRAVQHFYSLNLRTHALTHLSLADIGPDRKKEHDMRALKKTGIHELRQYAPKGRKVLYVWDPAAVDLKQWSKWKSKGIYFLSRCKANLNLKVKESLPIDSEDEINKGVTHDDIVLTRDDDTLRRVIYRCPLTKKTYTYLTNLHWSVRPGVIAFLYKTRWDIEKVFDQIKNKMNEKKSWSKSENGKTAQALFICLAHNLTLLMEDKLEAEGVENTKDKAKRDKKLEQSINQSRVDPDEISSLVKDIQRVTQRRIEFFRWLEVFVFLPVPWAVALTSIQKVYEVFS